MHPGEQELPVYKIVHVRRGGDMPESMNVYSTLSGFRLRLAYPIGHWTFAPRLYGPLFAFATLEDAKSYFGEFFSGVALESIKKYFHIYYATALGVRKFDKSDLQWFTSRGDPANGTVLCDAIQLVAREVW